MVEHFYIGNDYTVAMHKVVDESGTPLTAATVEATLTDARTGVEVPGVTWPLTLVHSSGGDYSAVIQSTVQTVKGGVYLLTVTVAEGDFNAQWDIKMIGSYRKM